MGQQRGSKTAALPCSICWLPTLPHSCTQMWRRQSHTASAVLLAELTGFRQSTLLTSPNSTSDVSDSYSVLTGHCKISNCVSLSTVEAGIIQTFPCYQQPFTVLKCLSEGLISGAGVQASVKTKRLQIECVCSST